MQFLVDESRQIKYIWLTKRGYSSVGRATGSQSVGHGFDSHYLHAKEASEMLAFFVSLQPTPVSSTISSMDLFLAFSLLAISLYFFQEKFSIICTEKITETTVKETPPLARRKLDYLPYSQ